MENLKNITEFVVVSNLENRALNAGINKAQNWWKNRHNSNEPLPNEPQAIPQATLPQATLSQATLPPFIGTPGQFMITILRGQDLHESRLSMIAASASERPYIIIECNQQRFQTMPADSNSTNRNPQWTTGNGPFGFNIYNLGADRLTIWVQQQESLRVLKRNESKMLGMGEINVRQLIDQQQVWLPLRKDNKPAGQVLLQIFVNSSNQSSASYNKIL
jgi:hypothetical protein